MRSVALSLILALAAVVAVPALAQDDGEGGGGGDNPACIDVSGASRYDGTGYLHIVRVHDGCDRAARCEVWTSVDAQRHRLDVEPGQTGEVITRRGSPAYAFTPYGRCTLAD